MRAKGAKSKKTGVADSARARVERRALGDLAPAPYNPREISDAALAGLRASLDRFGLVQPPIFNERTGHLVGGHQRVKAASALGETECDVVIVDIDPGEERALNVALNSPHIAGEFTDDLQDLLGEIEDFDAGLFTDLRLDELAVSLDGALPDETPPTVPIVDYRVVTITVPEHLWELHAAEILALAEVDGLDVSIA